VKALALFAASLNGNNPLGLKFTGFSGLRHDLAALLKTVLNTGHNCEPLEVVQTVF
jgi:hypothetical protein